MVHGGERFTEPALIDAAVLGAIEELEALAPLHNAPSLAGVRAAQAALGPDVPMVAVFDTAFHATIPEHASRYAIPHELALERGIRRYGFHGLAYRSVLDEYARMSGTGTERATLVAFHLGNGCSAVAIQRGRSVDTSMGLTPLEGLVMGTRSGDVDPALVGHLVRTEGVPVAEAERWLNERSGLRGLSGRSSDMRDLLARAARGSAGAPGRRRVLSSRSQVPGRLPGESWVAPTPWCSAAASGSTRRRCALASAPGWSGSVSSSIPS